MNSKSEGFAPNFLLYQNFPKTNVPYTIYRYTKRKILSPKDPLRFWLRLYICLIQFTGVGWWSSCNFLLCLWSSSRIENLNVLILALWNVILVNAPLVRRWLGVHVTVGPWCMFLSVNISTACQRRNKWLLVHAKAPAIGNLKISAHTVSSSLNDLHAVLKK